MTCRATAVCLLVVALIFCSQGTQGESIRKGDKLNSSKWFRDALEKIQGTLPPEQDPCTFAAPWLAALQDVQDVEGPLLAGAVGCAKGDAAANVIQLATSALTSSKPSISSGLTALEAFSELKANGNLPEAAGDAVAKFLEAVKTLWTAKDSLFQDRKGSPVSITATGSVLQMPRLLRALEFDEAGAFSQFVADTAGAAVAATLAKVEPTGALAANGDASTVQATAAYVMGLSQLDALPAETETLAAMLSFLRRHQALGNAEKAVGVARALHAYATSTAAPPIALMTLKSASLSTEGGTLTVSVTDPLGQPVSGAGVTVSESSRVLAGKSLKPSTTDPTTFTYSATTADQLAAGEHSLVIDGPLGASLSVPVTVTRRCDIEKVTWSSAAGKKHATRAQDLTGVALKEKDDVTVSVVVECGGDAFRPAHGTVTLATASGSSLTLVAAPDGGRLSASFTTSVVLKALQGSGPMSVTVSVGDRAMSKPIVWHVGLVAIDDLQLPPSKRDAPKPAMITHMHRPEHKQPLAFFPMLAVLVTLIPLVLWLVTLSRMNLNLNAFPKGSGGAAASLFLAALSSILVLSVYFWMRLSVVELAVPLFGLSLVLVVVGHKALSSLANERMAKASKRE